MQIHWDAIPKEFDPQFKKVPAFQSTTYGVRYDYDSVVSGGARVIRFARAHAAAFRCTTAR